MAPTPASWVPILLKKMDKYSFRVGSEMFDLRSEIQECDSLSPYSVPIEVCSYYDKKKKVFTLEFKFIDHSPKTKKIKFGDCVVFHVGKYGHVPYKLEVSVRDLKEEYTDSNFRLGHSIYMLLMNALEIYNFSKFDERDHPSKLQILYLRDNWVKLIYSPLGYSSLK